MSRGNMPRRKQTLPKKHGNMDDSGEEMQQLELVQEFDSASTATGTTDMRDSNVSPYADETAISPDLPQDLSMSSSLSYVSKLNNNGLSSGSAYYSNANDAGNDDVLDLSTKKRREFSLQAEKTDDAAATSASAHSDFRSVAVIKRRKCSDAGERRPSAAEPAAPFNAAESESRSPASQSTADLFALANYAALSSFLAQHNNRSTTLAYENSTVKMLSDLSAAGPSYSASPNRYDSSASSFFGSILKSGRESNTPSSDSRSPAAERTPPDAFNGCGSKSLYQSSSPVLANGIGRIGAKICSATSTMRREGAQMDPPTTHSKRHNSFSSPTSKIARTSPATNLNNGRSSRSSDLPLPCPAKAVPLSSASSFDALSKLSNLVSKVGSSNGSSIPTSSILHSNQMMSQSANLFSAPSIFGLFRATDAEQPPVDSASQLSGSISTRQSESAMSPRQALAPSAIPQELKYPSDGVNFHELWWKFVKKEENAEMKRLNEAKQIFTCLQCQASFQTMDQLVKHMEATQHYTNIPKHYSWSLQYARQKMRQMKMKMKYSDKMMYFCFLCHAPFTEPVQVHFNLLHDMHNPAENMKYVQIMSSSSHNNSDSTNNCINKNDKSNNCHSVPTTNANNKSSHRGTSAFSYDHQRITGVSNVRLASGHKRSSHSKNDNALNFVSNGAKTQTNFIQSGLEKVQAKAESRTPEIEKCENKLAVDKSLLFGDNPLSLLKNIVN